MRKLFAQNIIEDEKGRLYIEDDWHSSPLPLNMELEEMAYPDTAYSYTTCFSKQRLGFRLGYASGNYGHGIFTTGEHGEINIGKFVVLQCTRIIANRSVIIKDHCMFSWGSVITDTWVTDATLSLPVRRAMLRDLAFSSNRHLDFIDPRPVLIEENVWVGFDAIILPGVTIGRGAVIGCKAVVTEDIPQYAVVVGNPGRIIKYLEPNDSEEVRSNAVRQFLPII
jgi:acetyltransferase-like isoleucine patch superfamily enzyme